MVTMMNYPKLSLDQGVMTEEEMERCMAEIKNLTLKGEVNHSPGISKDAVSSTSTLAPQLAVQTMDDSNESWRETPATSGGRESVRNESLNLNYRASMYGPFNPSLVSAPVPVQPVYPNNPILNDPNWTGHSQGSFSEDMLLERDVAHNYFVHQGTPGVVSTPCSYNVQYKSDKKHRHYSLSRDNDLKLNHRKGHRKHTEVSKGNSNDAQHKRDSMAGGLSVNANPAFLNVAEQGSFMAGAAVDLSSSEQFHSQFSRPFELPLPTRLSFSRKELRD